jgi:hypothetical protein
MVKVAQFRSGVPDEVLHRQHGAVLADKVDDLAADEVVPALHRVRRRPSLRRRTRRPASRFADHRGVRFLMAAR